MAKRRRRKERKSTSGRERAKAERSGHSSERGKIRLARLSLYLKMSAFAVFLPFWHDFERSFVKFLSEQSGHNRQAYRKNGQNTADSYIKSVKFYIFFVKNLTALFTNKEKCYTMRFSRQTSFT